MCWLSLLVFVVLETAAFDEQQNKNKESGFMTPQRMSIFITGGGLLIVAIIFCCCVRWWFKDAEKRTAKRRKAGPSRTKDTRHYVYNMYDDTTLQYVDTSTSAPHFNTTFLHTSHHSNTNDGFTSQILNSYNDSCTSYHHSSDNTSSADCGGASSGGGDSGGGCSGGGDTGGGGGFD